MKSIKSCLMLISAFLLFLIFTQIESKNLKNISKQLKLNHGIKFIIADDGTCLSVDENFNPFWKKCNRDIVFQWETSPDGDLLYLKNYTEDNTSRFLTINQNEVVLSIDKLPLKYKVTKTKFNQYHIVNLFDENGKYIRKENGLVLGDEPYDFKFSRKHK